MVTVFESKYICSDLLISYGVILTAYGFNVTRSMKFSWLVQADNRVISFRKPAAIRRLGLLFAGLPFIGLLLIVSDNVDTFWQCPLSISLSLYCLYYLAGPDNTRLDLELQTYQSTHGWPWQPKIVSGPLTDFKGVCVTPRNAVLLLFRCSNWNRLGLQLSSSSQIDKSLALADYISKKLVLPVIPYPI